MTNRTKRSESRFQEKSLVRQDLSEKELVSEAGMDNLNERRKRLLIEVENLNKRKSNLETEIKNMENQKNMPQADQKYIRKGGIDPMPPKPMNSMNPKQFTSAEFLELREQLEIKDKKIEELNVQIV